MCPALIKSRPWRGFSAPQQNGGFYWSDIPGPAGGKFYLNFGVTQLLPKVKLQMTWRMVPENTLYGPKGFFGGWPETVFNIFGQVNSDQFLSFPPGTLLMLEPKITPVPSPFPQFTDWTLAQCLWDVEYNLLYFKYGHNQLCYPIDGTFHTVYQGNNKTMFDAVSYTDNVCVPVGG